MIRFNGYYSDVSLGKNSIRAYRKYLFWGMVGIVFASVFAIIGWKLKDEELFWTMCFCLAVGVVLIVFSLILLVNVHARMPKPYVDLQIDDEIILFNDGESSKKMYVSDVMKVKDLGREYHICFGKNSAMKLCVCEKDLLVEGDLADFEDLFKDKLVYKK